MDNKERLAKALDKVKEREMRLSILNSELEKEKEAITKMLNSRDIESLVELELCTAQELSRLQEGYLKSDMNVCNNILEIINTNISERVDEIERSCSDI